MAAIFYSLATLKARLGDKERGATAVEYALVIGLVSLVLIVAIVGLGGGLATITANINTFLGNAATSVPATP
jgi:pilus assembly protein Flp/PilA